MSKNKYRNYYDNVSERAVKVIPLGGLEMIGMNITAYEYRNSIIVVDCGLSFPEEDMLGVDLVVPDITYLIQNAEKIRGFFITHGHEDHIGALPYILKQLNIPVYATRLTMAIIGLKLDEHELTESVERHIVEYGNVIEAGDFSVEYIRVNHSISDSAALAITSPAGTIIHTGDFKVDYSPLFGEPTDLSRFAELGQKGVLALLSDSTNAMREGFTPSEQKVASNLNHVFASYPSSRIIISTFASHIDRIQLVADAAVQYGRKVAIDGRSMVSLVELGREMGYINCPDNLIVDAEQIQNYKDSELVIVMTGSQGEAAAALSRAAAGQHKKISITANDVIVFSSSPIPGNEKAVQKLVNEIAISGATVINKEMHVSGHACVEEIKLMYSLTKPKYAIPVHGEFQHRKANAEIAKLLQIPKDHIFLLNSGDVLTLSDSRGEVTGAVPHGGIMVDGLGVGDVGNVVIRDRQNLAQNGIVVVTFALSKATGELMSKPEMITRGVVYVRESENILTEARQVAFDTIAAAVASDPNDWNRIKAVVRDKVGSYFWQTIKRNPVVLPIILEVE